jgi:hypothetical protein
LHSPEHFITWLDELLERGAAIQRDTSYNAADWLSIPQFDGWSAAVEQFLIELLGPESVYYLRFRDAAFKVGVVKEGQRASCLQVLLSLRDDLVKGRLISFRKLVTAEVFSDFLDMAEHLLANGYKDPSASLIGAVLEIGLRDIASGNELKVGARDDLTALNNRLAEAAVYSRLVQKSINVWIAIRNYADHGQFEQYAAEDVKSMHTGVREFLGRFQ